MQMRKKEKAQLYFLVERVVRLGRVSSVFSGLILVAASLELKSFTSTSFLDDDDEMYPTHIETHMNALKTSDSMWSVGQYCIKTVDKGYTVSMKNIDKISHMTLEQFYYRNYIPINTYIIDRDRFNDAGLELKFLEHMIYLEDYAFLLNTFIKNKIKPAKVLSATINYTKTQNKSNKQLLCKSYVDILPIIQSIPKNIFFGITSTLFWNIKRLIKQCT